MKEILRPYVEVDVHSEKHESHPAEDDTALGNVFTILQLEEPSVSPLGTEPVLSQPRISFKFEPSQEEDKTVSKEHPKDFMSSRALTIFDVVCGVVLFARHVRDETDFEEGMARLRRWSYHLRCSQSYYRDWYRYHTARRRALPRELPRVPRFLESP